VTYGVDPREGYFEGDRYYHPDLRFVMDFPSGWKKQNSKSAILAQTGETAAMQVTIVNAGSLSPAQYVQKLRSDGQIAGANGSTTTIHGYPAWEGRVTIQDQAGNQGSLILIALRKDTRMFQILGQAASGSSGESAIVASARSFGPLTDTSRLNPTPARIRVVPAPRNGTLGQVVAAIGTPGADLDEIAILNGMDESTTIAQGRLIKTITPARFRP